MFAEHSAPVLDDRARFRLVTKLLPEKFVYDLVDFYLYNAYFPITHQEEFFGKYSEKQREILLEFTNPKIKAAFKGLNASFGQLMQFLTTHYYLPRRVVSPYYYLEPRLHHNFRMSEISRLDDEAEASAKWDEYKRENDLLAEEFKQQYTGFLRTVTAEFARQEKTKGLRKWLIPILAAILAAIASSVITSLFLRR